MGQSSSVLVEDERQESSRGTCAEPVLRPTGARRLWNVPQPAVSKWARPQPASPMRAGPVTLEMTPEGRYGTDIEKH